MVGRGNHGADTVVAGGQATGDGGGQETIAVTGVVDTFEEDELGSVWGGVGGEGASEILNSDVSVTNNLTVTVDLLGRRVVGVVRVGEGTGIKVRVLNVDVEVLVLIDIVIVSGAEENTRDHVLG